LCGQEAKKIEKKKKQLKHKENLEKSNAKMFCHDTE